VKLYLDSSVLVAAFAPEKFSQRAMDLLGNASEVVVSELTVTEARVSLVRKRKRKAMTAEEVAEALAEIAEAIQDGTLGVEPLPVEIFRAAEALADRVAVPVRAMDALHVAMAAQLGAEMATFDADQATAAKAEGITVHTDKR
jgi:uncharacterized protein